MANVAIADGTLPPDLPTARFDRLCEDKGPLSTDAGSADFKDHGLPKVALHRPAHRIEDVAALLRVRCMAIFIGDLFWTGPSEFGRLRQRLQLLANRKSRHRVQLPVRRIVVGRRRSFCRFLGRTGDGRSQDRHRIFRRAAHRRRLWRSGLLNRRAQRASCSQSAWASADDARGGVGGATDPASIETALNVLCAPHRQALQQCAQEYAERHPPHGFVWKRVGVDDCGGRDISCSAGASPSQLECNAQRVGITSVCWTSGGNKGYPPFPGCQGGPPDWCTYKSESPDVCKGGGAPGAMWVCAQE